MTTILSNENLPVMIAVRNDGIIYAVERGDELLKIGYYDELYEKQLENLKRQVRNDTITQAEYGKQKELIIVHNLIKDYMKGGKVHVFNR